ncbi:MAG TPA: hypothetical protein VE008_07095 [Burkholderiales bacterium]|nr:hypothetical protein [Burkholderiales bacterium]
MNSTRVMVDKLEGLLGTEDLNEWEQKFVSGLVDKRDENKLVGLSERQIDSLQKLHDKHFA